MPRVAPGSWGNVEGCILPASSSRNMGPCRVEGGSVWHVPAASWGRRDSGPSLPWAGSITVHLMDVLTGESSYSPIWVPKASWSRGCNPLGIAHLPWVWVACHGKGGWLLPLPRTQLLTPTPVRGELSSWWMVSTNICGMVPQGAFEWCLESIPVQGSRTLSG